MKIPDHISESLEKIFWVKKTLKFFEAYLDPESFLTRDPARKISDPG
jgi:hypothetical protein